MASRQDIQFPRFPAEHESTTYPLSRPPSETLPTPPRRNNSHAPRISPSPQARNAIYFPTSKSAPSTIGPGPAPARGTSLISFVDFASSATANPTKSQLPQDSSPVPAIPSVTRKSDAALFRPDRHGLRDNSISPHTPHRGHHQRTLSAVPHANRSLRPSLSSPAIYSSTTAPPPPSSILQPRSADSRRYCTDFDFGSRYDTQQLRDELQEVLQHPKPRFQPVPPLRAPLYYGSDNDDARSSPSSTDLTPFATHADSEASESSFDYEHDRDLELELAFPRPPENPKIPGRVKDMLLYSEQDTDAFKHFLRRWEASIAARRVMVGENVVGETRDEEELSDFSWEALSSVPHGDDTPARVDMVNPPNRRAREAGTGFPLQNTAPLNPRPRQTGPVEGSDGNVRRRALYHNPISDDVVHPVVRNQDGGTRGGGGINKLPAVEEWQEQSPHVRTNSLPKTIEPIEQRFIKSQRSRKFTPSLPSSTRVPQIIRKVASMSIKVADNDEQSTRRRSHIPDIPKPTITPRLIAKPSLSALSRLEDSVSKLQQYHGQTTKVHQVDRPIRARLGGKRSVGSALDFAYFEKSSGGGGGGGNPGRHRVQASASLADTGGPWASADSSDPSKAAKTPFLHRSTRSQPTLLLWSTPRPTHVGTWSDSRGAGAQSRTEEERMRSFMDITPEQDPSRSSGSAPKDKVRRLLARASSGFIGWGKSLARKKN